MENQVGWFIVIGESIEVVRIEGDEEIVIEAGGKNYRVLKVFRVTKVLKVFKSAKFERVLRHYVGAGDVGVVDLVWTCGIGILIVNIVGALEGVHRACGYHVGVNVGVSNDLIVGGEHLVGEVTLVAIQLYFCYLDVTDRVIFLGFLKGKAKQSLGVVKGDVEVRIL